jgi:polysaccharide deacetylase family protein (PEP-CTERM system associated)
MGNHRVIEGERSTGKSGGTAAPAATRAAEVAPGETSRSKCIFSVDVEDWFHILDLPSTPPISDWDQLPSRVEQNFLKLLDIFSEKNASVTCFFLGWVAQKFPHLVREAAKRGHEIASHGYAHRLVYQLTQQEFLDDATKSKKILEDAAGRTVLGYRSAGFSVTEDTPWFFEMLMEAGYRYDSSVFPAPRGHGGLEGAQFTPFLHRSGSHTLVEFPITIKGVFGKPICFYGGGYLRLFPYALIRRMTRVVLAEGRPVIFYVHPREIDPHHPRLAMGLARRFKSYVNLRTTEPKIRRLLSEFEFTTFEKFIEEDAELSGTHSHAE